MSSSGNESDESLDKDRSEIRAELSSLSFEELQKLKERIGSKVYNEALFGKKEKKDAPKVFKRENKNRPREMSSKKPVPLVTPVSKHKKTTEVRDPRFDPLCGEFDNKQFSENYSFLTDVRAKDIKVIRDKLRKTTDPERETKLRRLLQRLNDQQKAGKQHKVEHEKKVAQVKQAQQEYSDGRQPHFKNKSESKVEALLQQYEELKKEGTGRVQRHLKRRQQKLKKRSNRAPTGVS